MPLASTTQPQPLCRDCLTWLYNGMPDACPRCGSPRLIHHAELRTLSIAHIDCDAFYASVEKRDDPSIADKPVIVGGGRRGVVSAACYIARIHGIRSAMPMFKALAACPDAVVIRPNMKKYSTVGLEIRALMREATPLVEPLSIDEAFLDLTGTQRLHKSPPAETLARLILRIQSEIGITASIGLSYNKFLAKVSSDLDKPRGFSVIGRAEAMTFMAPLSATVIWGVGKSLHRKLLNDGLRTVGDLQGMDERDLIRRYGSIGGRMARFSRGVDDRRVEPTSVAKSVSNETTFNNDLTTVEQLRPVLWKLSESLSTNLKRKHISGRVVTVKLKTADFKSLTRRISLGAPTQLADTIYRTTLPLLQRELDGRRFRLLGVGMSELNDDQHADPPDLADPDAERRKKAELAMDKVREKLGRDAIEKGHSFGRKIRPQSPANHLETDEETGD
ncbi:MAG: DNA polymerase IV [Alphaproteobacteria bacterium]|nr:DNA polymerase IV [Alphaproteobacteria bacterium]